MSYGKKEEQIFLGREIAQHRDYSEDTAIAIDREVRRLVDEGYNRAKNILETERDLLIKLAEILLERETLDASEIRLIIDGKDLPPRPPLTPVADQGTVQVLKPERKPVTGAEPAPA